MSNEFKMYLLTRLDSVQVLTFIVFVIAIVCSILYAIAKGTEYNSNDVENKYLKPLKKLWIAGIVALLIAAITPSKNEAIFIIAGGKAMDFAQSDSSLNKIPAQATKVISDMLDKKIKEANEEGK